MLALLGLAARANPELGLAACAAGVVAAVAATCCPGCTHRTDSPVELTFP
jgi:cyclic lactone autoinducer peptide